MKFEDRVLLRDTLREWLQRCQAGVEVISGGPPAKIIALLKDNRPDPAEGAGPP